MMIDFSSGGQNSSSPDVGKATDANDAVRLTSNATHAVPRLHPVTSTCWLNQRSTLLLIAAFALFLAGLGFRSFATAQGVPVLAVDSCVFLPQAVTYRDTGDLINPVWPTAKYLDPQGKGRMVYHGFLFPMTLATLMWRNDYLALAGSLAIVQALATLLPGFILLSVAKRWNWKLTTERWFLILFLTVAGANYAQGSSGRPEPLAGVLLASAVIIACGVSWRWGSVVMGIAIGLTTAVDPLVGIFAGVAFAAYATWRFTSGQALLESAIVAAISLLAFGCALFIYPYSFHDWLSGTWRMGHYAVTHASASSLSNWKWFVRHYFRGGSTWFLGGTILLVLWSGYRIVQSQVRNKRGPRSPVLFLAVLIIAAAAAWRFIFYASWTRYTVLPFIPLGFIAVFYELGRDIVPSTGQRFYRTLAALTLIVASLGFAFDLWQRIQIFEHGQTLPRARERFQTLRASHSNSIIAIPESLFTLTEDYRNLIFTASRRSRHDADIRILAQALSPYVQPPHLNGFQLIENDFNPRPTSRFGIPLWRVEWGCGFAAYSRDIATSR